MIPSLVVDEIQDALIEFLTSTFALTDDAARDALAQFLTDNAEGIFRGPYLRVRTPFRSVSTESWTSPLGWLPDWFVPYIHQAQAFDRLSSARGHLPEPTIVTTGTGSGKTECFLMPMLDHCARMREAKQDGIKALILYPMNALASDQAGRIAELVVKEPRLEGLRVGMYVGSGGRHSSMGPDHVIDKREVLRANPPDILLTNYKMLDFLLLRPEDRDLWAVNSPSTLQYLVLDEFHTYDGAQGSDVAMLLRRLGAALGMARPGLPLGDATPVATSATLGSSATALDELRSFASKVFGAEFDRESVIGESRQTPQEACLATNYAYEIPEAQDIAFVEDLDEVARAFCYPDGDEFTGDLVDLGERLLAHTLTHGVLGAVADSSKAWSDAVAEIAARAPSWGKAMQTAPQVVEKALSQFVRLLSVARRSENGKERPLFSIEVQLWIREVSRLQRSVTRTPAFRWRDSGAADTTAFDAVTDADVVELPSIYCRRCGASGWMTLKSEATHSMSTDAKAIGRSTMDNSPLSRALMLASDDDPTARWFNTASLILEDTKSDDSIAVYVSDDEEHARRSTCPSCGERNTVRYLGTAVAGLASVTINTLFGSGNLQDNERKLLAFTDSVQDASHRASFFGGRTHRINLRSLMSRILQQEERVSLADFGARLYDEAATPRDRFGLVPPDLLRDPLVRTVWSDQPDPKGVDILVARLGFEADLEFGLRSRVGRTLELSQAAVASVEIEDFDTIVELIGEDIEAQTGARLDSAAIRTYVLGLVDRLRLRGGLMHPLLNRFVEEGGDSWWIWGGRPAGLPPFATGQGRPSLYTTATKTELDSVAVLTQNPSWLVDWAMRSLGVAPKAGRDINERTISILSRESDTVVAHERRGSTVYGIDRRFVYAADLPDETPEHPLLRCTMCGHLHVSAPETMAAWLGAPCIRYRCGGFLEAAPDRQQQYYRDLYRSGATRRVVTGEHTGLLQRTDREDLETAFKKGTAPDAPNVITATPTLEMGIDIGDLSAVMLTSVPRNPASYIQRVGRSGRLTGNSLVTTFVKSDTHSLYYLSEPQAMLAGDVRSPNCYLDAAETLQRQFIAYMIDRLADGTIDGPAIPREAVGLFGKANSDEAGAIEVIDPGSFLATIIDVATQEPAHVETFITSFGDQIEPATADQLREFAAGGMQVLLTKATQEFRAKIELLRIHVQRLAGAIDRGADEAAEGRRSQEDEADLRDLRGQRKQLQGLMRSARQEYSLSAMERLGVLPSYTLGEETVELVASLWSSNEAGEIETETIELSRGSRLALTELAPGSSFYASGHRHQIDTVKIGTSKAPLTEDWRVCPECSYIERVGDNTPATCPRCASVGFADTGAQFKTLRLTEVYSGSSEEAARVFDQSDDRVRRRYNTTTLVDGDPTTISSAWHLRDRVFGAELIGKADIRTLNLGHSDRNGLPRFIGGQEFQVPGFTVCSHCGAVEEARDDQDGRKPERLHQGYCRVRSGSVKAAPENLVLFHELRTEAVRMLLPISLYEVEERLASFRAALLLGLREDFGGDPDHLEVVASDAPNREGAGRRRFLVLYDRVPGGTGYLGRLGDPDRVKAILEKARNVIARCQCAAEGRQACHRCLLGVTDRQDYDLVSRDLALELLDGQLHDWDPQTVETISDLEIGQVEESELERRFRVALQHYAEVAPESMSFRSIKAKNPPYQSFELTFTAEGKEQIARYRIDEQEGLGTTPSVLPDFVFRRLDQPGKPVAVFCDGFEYHASASHNAISVDAEKRAGIRFDDMLVWNLSWSDVTEFDDAVRKVPLVEAKDKPLLDRPLLKVAEQVQQGARPAGYVVDAINQNPMALLLDYLSRPSEEEWRYLAQAAVAAIAQGSAVGPVDVEQLPGIVAKALGSQPIERSAPSAVPVAFVGRHVTTNGLAITAILDSRPNRIAEQRWTAIAVLPDANEVVSGDSAHRDRWTDWIQWANVLQFLTANGQQAVIAGATGAAALEADELEIMALTFNVSNEPSGPEAEVVETDHVWDAPKPTAELVAVELTQDMLDELDLVEAIEVAKLTTAALTRGAPVFEAGPEVNGVPIEAAWNGCKVGIMVDSVDVPLLDGWIVRRAADWTVEELVQTIMERS